MFSYNAFPNFKSRVHLKELTGNGIGRWNGSPEKSMWSELAVRLKQMSWLILVNIYGYSRLRKT
jgi:hypothetical protein